MRFRPAALAAAVLTTAALPALMVPSAAQAQEAEATVSVLHAVPDLTVDVYANGEELLTDFEPGTLTDPLTLPADTYDLQVFPAGEGPDGDPAIETSDVKVPAGANATVVAHLSENGTPQLTPYVNDTSKVAAGEARLTVRHDAAAPAVDVRAGGEPVFTGLTNPNEDSADLPAGSVSADVVLAGTDDVAIGPADLDLAEGTHTIVYAWGSAEDDNLALATQSIGGLHSAPAGVPAGETGLAAEGDGGVAPWAVGLAAAATLGVALSGARLVRSRA
ncbi:MAG: DUF4397 domain-containing protein [Actinomycetes bacterium]